MSKVVEPVSSQWRQPPTRMVLMTGSVLHDLRVVVSKSIALDLMSAALWWGHRHTWSSVSSREEHRLHDFGVDGVCLFRL